ncbi:putative cytoplasm protein [Naematelia encephala]|uniref:Putative cytoplasm protein n=1 Tax=Naematelia encephala TaxID=71784 RepID=A0A1Y2BHT3_9TREE|nr:putative cytoplasm protein [Naematelia encephala]
MPPKVAKEDKTFGMKNKNKSKKVQSYIDTVQKQQSQAGKNKEALAKDKEKEARALAKKNEEAKKKMELELFGPVQVQKIPFGTDPKTVLCVYFKAGHCQKGTKCKFSHDRNVERKVEKVNIYEDARKEKKDDTMDTWDEEKLRNVVGQNAQKQRNATDIVCKYFIQAIEDKKYGWLPPNGGDKCMYRHALPPGFVLKSEKKAAEEAAKKDQISLEEFVEVERHKLKPPLTPVTAETFAIWKKSRLEKKQAEAEAAEKAKAVQRAAGKLTGLSGRDMFQFGGELFEDEEADGDDWDISRLLARYREDDTRPEGYDDQGENAGQSDGDASEVGTITNGVEEVKV